MLADRAFASTHRLLGIALLVFALAVGCGSDPGASTGIDPFDAGSIVVDSGPECVGSPTPCSLLAGLSCSSASGCSLDEKCSGIESSCSTFFSSFTCNAQDGCSWSSSNSRCTGFATPCNLVFGASRCRVQDGCRFESACRGTPNDCKDLGPALCASQPGCVATGVSDGGAAHDGGSADAARDTGDASNGCDQADVTRCRCGSDADCSRYQSSNLCAARLACRGQACLADPGTAVVCDTSMDTACRRTQCVPSTGQCAGANLADGSFCNDGLYCTANDHCFSGTCVGSGSPCFLSCETCDEGSRSCPASSTSCVINAQCYATGAGNPANACQVCVGGASAWSNRVVGTSCATNNVCRLNGACDSNAACVGVMVIPPVPIATSPMSGTRTGSVLAPSAFNVARPLFRWREATDSCFDAVTYDVQVDDSCPATGFQSCTFPSPEGAATNVVTTSWRPTSDLAMSRTPPVGTRYYWRVRACRAGGRCSSWSSVHYVDVGRAEFDFDGDGYSDAAFGSMYSNPPPMPGFGPRGRVYLYRGMPTLSSTPTGTIEQPDLANGELFGEQIAIGDVNGDGFADLAASSHWTSSTEGRYYLYVFHGSASGLGATPSTVLSNTDPKWAIGPIMTMRGDVDGDGYDDLVASVSNPNNFEFARAHFGSPTGISTIPGIALTWYPNDGVYDFASHADINGDAIADFIVRTGSGVRVWSGALALTTWPTTPSFLSDSDTRVSDRHNVATGADINGDGIHDIVTGGFRYVNNVLYSTLVLMTLPVGATSLVKADLLVAPAPTEESFGYTASIEGDIDADGRADLLLAIEESPSEVRMCKGTSIQGAPAYRLAAPTNTAFARAVRFAGDLNGDGYPDTMAATPFVLPAGKVLMCIGASNGIVAGNCTTLVNPDPNGAYYGEVSAR